MFSKVFSQTYICKNVIKSPNPFDFTYYRALQFFGIWAMENTIISSSLRLICRNATKKLYYLEGHLKNSDREWKVETNPIQYHGRLQQ
jgi:hypothetical protein